MDIVYTRCPKSLSMSLNNSVLVKSKLPNFNNLTNQKKRWIYLNKIFGGFSYTISWGWILKFQIFYTNFKQVEPLFKTLKVRSLFSPLKTKQNPKNFILINYNENFLEFFCFNLFVSLIM